MKPYYAKSVDDIEAEIRDLDARRAGLVRLLKWRRMAALKEWDNAERAVLRAERSPQHRG